MLIELIKDYPDNEFLSRYLGNMKFKPDESQSPIVCFYVYE